MALLGQFLEQPSIRKYIWPHMYFLPACNHLSVLDKLLTQCLAVWGNSHLSNALHHNTCTLANWHLYGCGCISDPIYPKKKLGRKRKSLDFNYMLERPLWNNYCFEMFIIFCNVTARTEKKKNLRIPLAWFTDSIGKMLQSECLCYLIEVIHNNN